METLITPTQAQKELEDVLHHFMTLSERWNEDRQAMAKQNAELGKLVVRLSVQVEKLKEADDVLKRQVSQSIEGAAHSLAEKTAGEFKKHTMRDVEYVTERLKKVAQETSQQLEAVYQDHKSANRMAILALFTVPIMVSLLIFWWLSPKPMLALNDEQMLTYKHGQALEGIWPKLNKKQQKWLSDVGTGKIRNRGMPLDEIAGNT